MRIQDTFHNCCGGIKNFAYAAGASISKAFSNITTCVKDGAAKAAAYVKPHFEHLKTYARENKQQLVIGTVAFILGTIVTAIISRLFCKATNTTPAGQQARQAAAPDPTVVVAAPVPVPAV